MFLVGSIRSWKKFWFIYLFTYNGFAWTNTWFSFSLFGVRSYIRRYRSRITYQHNLFYLFVGTGSCLYILILYFIKFPFGSCRIATYLRGSYKCFNHICCDVYEWFRILQRFEFLDCWGWGYFADLYHSFLFINGYYFRYVMVWDYLNYQIKPDYRAGFDK